MKKTFMSLALALLLPSAAWCQIPTTDIANISAQAAQFAQTVQHYTQQISALKSQLDEAKRLRDSISGSRGLGGILKSSALRPFLPQGAQDLLKVAESLPGYQAERAKYPNPANSPKAKKYYDKLAGYSALMADLYDKSATRVKQVQDLNEQIDMAADPAAKEDLQNRFVAEQNEIQSNLYQFQVLKEQQKIDLEQSSREAQGEYKCKEFKRPGC